MHIHLIAVLQARPGRTEALKNLLLSLVADSRREQACIQYDLHQSISDEQVFVFYEIWESQQGLDAHNAQPYIKAFQQSAKELLLDEPQVYLTAIVPRLGAAALR